MKNYFKRIVAFILVIVCTISFSIGANATESQTGETSVTYEVRGSYTLVIPSSVSVGDNFTISVTDYNMASDKYLQVVLGSIWGDGYIRLFNDEDVASGLTEGYITSYVDVALYADGTLIDTSNRILGYFSGEGNSISLKTEYISSSDGRAGTYTGTISFCVNCVNY